jgi:FixJ family two-component response regulator
MLFILANASCAAYLRIISVQACAYYSLQSEAILSAKLSFSRLSTFGGLLVDASEIVTIVDDEEAVRVATADLVRSLGWQVRTFASAEAFLESGHLKDTSCLILDVRMPGMSGVALHARLRSQGHVPPTIFITAFPTADLHAEVIANGALALLEKPAVADDVAHWLEIALKRPFEQHEP